jgi:hypothetical protein
LRHHVQRDAQEVLLRRNDRSQLSQSFSLPLHVHSAWFNTEQYTEPLARPVVRLFYPARQA